MLHTPDAALTTVNPRWGELLDLAEAMRDLAERATTDTGAPALTDLVRRAS